MPMTMAWPMSDDDFFVFLNEFLWFSSDFGGFPAFFLLFLVKSQSSDFIVFLEVWRLRKLHVV